MLKSIFTEIPGIGLKRIDKLWQVFSSLKEIQDININKMVSKTGFSEKLCKIIKLQSEKYKI